MNIDKAIILSAILFVSNAAFAEDDKTYIDCLKDSLNGSHNFSAEDVRSLCMEISGTQDASYSWTEKSMVPNNNFTKCYDSEVNKLDSLSKKRAGEVAKIICRYEAR
jgi:hypothetical protein